MKPHLSRYWLNNARTQNPEIFDAQVKIICELYAQAQNLYEKGIYLISTDEKTGIQALERLSPTRLMAPGQIELREFEYQRHGTQALIANFVVATGCLLSPTVGSRRTEMDFALHLARTIATAPNAKWIFISDQLNTHMSETLVRVIAAECDLDQDLGVKEKEGILKSMATRAAFLSDESHRIRFVYTPSHCSWLNQIEIWFSILVRRLLKRASFSSTDELRERILAFIDYFNKTMAKPFKWTYAGRPLKA